MDFSFFTTDNKSGYKTNEKWFSKNHPEVYNTIIEYSENICLELPFKEKILFFFKKLTERPKCLTCGSEIKFRNRFDKPYGEFCSLNCINTNSTEMTKRIKNTIQEKYGVDFYPQHNEFIKKQKQTKLVKYGDENYSNILKQKHTKLVKYGNENYVNVEKYKDTCLIRYGDTNYSKTNNYKNKIIQNYISLYPNVNFINIKKDTITIDCPICNKESELTKQLLYERNKREYIICTNCNPVGHSSISGYQNEIVEFIKTLNVDILQTQKIPNKRTEIDIVLPNYNLGIEFNGLYCHNELFKTKNYHLQKTNDAKLNNINLIHIFEDEWIYKKDIVKSILKNKLNKIESKIYARKCVIKEISQQESKNFLNDNHIQGNVNSKVRLGLFYNDNLVSVMTFSKGRVIMGGKKNEWELNRFSNKLNTNVVGGASKLLNYFIRQYQPIKLISYSDIRLFDGGMYEKLGFTKISQSKPNYWYIINDTRKHRFNYRKSILVKEGYDKNMTEQKIMFDRKIYRIYDCGNIRWEINHKSL
jgi:hypothetical protein